MTPEQKAKILTRVLIELLALGAWIYLMFYDWRLAVVLFLIKWPESLKKSK